MKVLFDHCVPDSHADHFERHHVVMARSQGWDRLKNGALIAQAETAGFAAIMTTDQGFLHQQSLASKEIGVILLIAHPSVTETLAKLVQEAGEKIELGISGEIVTIRALQTETDQ